MIIPDYRVREFCEIETTSPKLIEPFRVKNLQPASYDMILGNRFMIPVSRNEEITLNEPPQYNTIIDHSIVIGPGQFMLATTQEKVALPYDIVGKVEGCSSIGRMGLFIQNAGHIDPGFKGTITLELFNAAPYSIKLEAGERICQVVFSFMDEPCESPYQGRYQNQKNTTGWRASA